MDDSTERLVLELTVKYGATQRQRLERGLRQVRSLWRPEDGDEAALAAFVRRHFAGDQPTLDAMLERYETILEQVGGHLREVGMAVRRHETLDLGPVLPFDELFSAWSPGAHVQEDLFRNKLAFVALLNFPLTTLDERLREGPRWSRRQWAEARLAQGFGRRVPAEVSAAMARASASVERYTADYNVWMHHVLDREGRRLFPAGMKLLSHWNLRDELRADYADGAAGLAKQRLIQRVMERIVDQTIPRRVIDNPEVDWEPVENQVRSSDVRDGAGSASAESRAASGREPDTRYERILEAFHAARLADPYSPAAPTHLARSFDDGRELPEPRVRALLEEVLRSPLAARVAALVRERVGRPLEPFDIWYAGFRPRGRFTEAELDALVGKKYPTPAAFQADIPRILRKLGFSAERARWLATHVAVEPARGSGHAAGAGLKTVPSRLRTRIPRDGMNYKGFNVAIHELGHNVEQTISLHLVDHNLLSGVPNTAFTEALAYLFQGRDLEVLGVARPDPLREACEVLQEFWATWEMAGVALVDLDLWRWMYAHPDGTPAELREAALSLARCHWNRFYEPVVGGHDVTLLAIYSHIVNGFLYLPDYPLGHMINVQIGEHLRRSEQPGAEIERMMKTGSVAPDLWMQEATGAPVGAESLLAATERSLAEVGGGSKGTRRGSTRKGGGR